MYIPQQGYGLEGGTYFSVQGGKMGGQNLSSRGGQKVGQGGRGGQKFFVQNRRFFKEKIAFFEKYSPKFAIFPRKIADFSQDHEIFWSGGDRGGEAPNFGQGGIASK